MFGVEPAIHVQHPQEADAEQRGHDQERHGQPDLDREQQRMAADRSAIAGDGGRARAERGLHAAATRTPGGDQRDDEPGDEREGECEQYDAAVERDIVDAGQVHWRGANEQAQRGRCDQESEPTAHDREEQMFEQGPGDESCAAGTQRRTHGRLARASERSGQRQVGEVGAGDQQHASDRAQEEQQALAHATDQVVAQRDHEARIGEWFLRFARRELGHLHLDDIQFRARLLEGHAVPQAANALVVVIADPADVHAKRDERVRRRANEFIGQPELRPQDADDRMAPAIEQDRLADDCRVALESRLPQGVADDGHIRCALRFIRWRQRSPPCGRRS